MVTGDIALITAPVDNIGPYNSRPAGSSSHPIVWGGYLFFFRVYFV